VLHARGWLKIQDAKSDKIAKNSPSAHHRTTLSSCIFATKACRQSEKNLLNRISPPHVRTVWWTLAQWPTNGWDWFGSLGHPSEFQRVSRLAFVTAATSLAGIQPNFARCLAISWAGTLY